MNIPFLVSSQSASQAGLASQTQTRKGDPCGQDGCTSKRFRLGDDGTWYCRNGHQQPEGLEAGVDEGDFQRTLGRQVTTAQPTEEQVRVRDMLGTSLTGAEAFELYLLCYQHILRHQCRWLIEQGPCLPLELESIVHDLWSLRLQSLTILIPSLVGEDEAPIQQLFSSQAESADEDANDTLPKARTGRPPESTPKLIDMLCLIYLAIQLLHIPYNFSDIQEWVHSSSRSPLPYYRAIRCLPSSMRQKLPGSYHHVLEPTGLLSGDALHHAFTEVILYYRTQFGMVVPPLNYPLLLFRYIKTLALPLEVYGAAKKVATIADYAFQCPDSAISEHDGRIKGKRSIKIEDWPDAQLAAVLVVATKLLFPFDDIKRYPRKNSEAAVAVMDWTTWADLIIKKEKGSTAAASKANKTMQSDKALRLQEDDLLRLNEEELDSYLDWYQDTWMENEIKEHGRHRSTVNLRRSLYDMFPIRNRQNSDPTNLDNLHISSSPPAEDDAEPTIREAGRRKDVREEDVAMAEDDTAPISHPRAKRDDREEDIIALIQSSLLPQRVISEEAESALPPTKRREVNRPGSYYRQWRSVEDLDIPLADAQPTSTSTRERRSTSKGPRGARGTTGASGEKGKDLVSMPARVFAERVAKETGLELEALVKAVWKTEVRLRRWDLARRREEEGWSSGEDGARG